jgi:hypothetical protein
MGLSFCSECARSVRSLAPASARNSNSGRRLCTSVTVLQQIDGSLFWQIAWTKTWLRPQASWLIFQTRSFPTLLHSTPQGPGKGAWGGERGRELPEFFRSTGEQSLQRAPCESSTCCLRGPASASKGQHAPVSSQAPTGHGAHPHRHLIRKSQPEVPGLSPYSHRCLGSIVPKLC